MSRKLSGVIAAIATPINAAREPDVWRFVTLANHLLHNGCDGLNVLGTTGEATSFSVAQRMRVMTAAADGADVSRMMVGAGAAALEDAIALTRHAAQLGFAGALVLPPFYYKGVSDEGVVASFAAIIEAAPTIPLYLYHYPALSGVPFTPALVGELLRQFPGRIVGLKDSSGDMAYARSLAQAHHDFAVFPSQRGSVARSPHGGLRGLHFRHLQSERRSQRARLSRRRRARSCAGSGGPRAVRRKRPLVAGVKAGLAHLHGDPALAEPMPPLVAWPAAEQAALGAALDALA